MKRLAPQHGYETRKESAVPWEKVPANNKSLMIAVCEEILKTHRLVPVNIEVALEECRKWRMTDEEAEELMK